MIENRIRLDERLHFGSDLHVGYANVVPSAVLLDDDGIGLGGRDGAEDGREGARAAAALAVAHLFETVAHFRFDGRQLIANQRSDVDHMRATR